MHMERLHGLSKIELELHVKAKSSPYLIQPITYPQTKLSTSCPQPHFPFTSTESKVILHVERMHPTAILHGPIEPLYHCELCGIYLRRPITKEHQPTQIFLDLTSRRTKRDTHSNQVKSQSKKFFLNGVEIETVTSFKYLGCHLKDTNRDDLMVCANITKSKLQWNCIAPVLRANSFPTRIKGLFYKAIIQAIILFCSESWNLPLSFSRI